MNGEATTHPLSHSLRGFSEAERVLSTLISRRSRADVSTKGDPAERFAMLKHYVEALELTNRIAKLKVIHVAGTKGKGSTCAFSESILRSLGYSTGLFTSPHLVNVRERFRHNGKEVDEEIFLVHFWWCFDKLQSIVTEDLPMPGYFRFLTLLAFRIFSALNVDVVLLEVGIGGKYDDTNVVPHPIVTGISSLGLDHMELLGNTVREIARQKAGIFKPGVPAVTALGQEKEALDVLKEEADLTQVPLLEAPPLPAEVASHGLGLAGAHQRVNAALAVALCRVFELRASSSPLLTAHGCSQALAQPLSAEYRRGLLNASWPGRCQVLPHLQIVESSARQGEGALLLPVSGSPAAMAGLSMFLDGAHTPESMRVCGLWFAQHMLRQRREQTEHCDPDSMMLLFNCMPERDPYLLFPPLMAAFSETGIPLPRLVVTPGTSSYTSVGPFQSPAAASKSTGAEPLSWQRKIQAAWEELQGNESTAVHELRPENNGFASLPSSVHGFPKSALQGVRSRCFVGPSSLVVPSISAALSVFNRSLQQQQQQQQRQGRPSCLKVLVTGSLHLVGDILKLVR